MSARERIRPVSIRAEGELQIVSWKEIEAKELADGARIAHVRIEETLAGDIVGTSSWDDLLYTRADGTATFVTLGQIEGELRGRRGTFAVTTTGAYDGETATSECVIVAGSGTGELKGVTGTGSMATRQGEPGTYRIDYELEPEMVR